MERLRHLTVLLCALAFILSSPIQAQPFRQYDEGPIHEAYLQRTAGDLTLEAVPDTPPEEIRENIPPQPNPGSIWLAGYWSWIPDINDFIWVGGTWRKPPPGHQWIRGFWKHFDEGWAWIRGFWSPLPKETVAYIDVPPPDSVDELIPAQPGPDFFWSPGFWVFADEAQEYYWTDGRWEKLDPNWVLVPAHYLWRPEGYVFIPAYWDWPAEGRGSAYSSIFIEPASRIGFAYQPAIIIEPLVVVRRCFIYYPDYPCFYWHHFHFHREWWWGFADTPPWWGWPDWWCYTWHDQWGLWWWYGHPGYPQPHWLTKEMASKIAPPPESLFKLVKNIRTPLVVTPNGVVSQGKLLKSYRNYIGRGKLVPVLPENKNLLDKIKHNAAPDKMEPDRIIRPVGKKEDLVNIKAGKFIEQKPSIKGDQAIKRLPQGMEKKIKSQNEVLRLPAKPSGQPIFKPDIQKPSETKDKIERPQEIKPVFRKPDEVQEKIERPKEVKPIFRKPDEVQEKQPKEIKPIFRKPDAIQEKMERPKEMKPIFKKPEDFKEQKIETQPQIITVPRRGAPVKTQENLKSSEQPGVFYQPKPKAQNIKVLPPGSPPKQDQFIQPKIQSPQQPFVQPKGEMKGPDRIIQPKIQSSQQPFVQPKGEMKGPDRDFIKPKETRSQQPVIRKEKPDKNKDKRDKDD